MTSTGFLLKSITMPEITSNLEVSTDEYIELLLRHMVRCPEVWKKAKEFHLVGEDFMLDEEFGMAVYKAVVDALYEIDECPVAPDLLGLHLSKRFARRELSDTLEGPTADLMVFIYEGIVMPNYFVKTMKAFVQHRRSAKLVFSYQQQKDPVKLMENMQQLTVDIARSDGVDGGELVNPWISPVFSEVQHTVLTGYSTFDQVTNGLAPGEYGQVVGYSGGGKTAWGCGIVYQQAVNLVNASFVSLEAPAQEISNRWYARAFNIPYTELHKGSMGARQQLTEAFADPGNAQVIGWLKDHTRIEGLKGCTPVTVDQIYAKLVQTYETTGFRPRLIVVDQLQFIEPRTRAKSDPEWIAEKKAAAEVDELSHMTIGGQDYCVWLLHQAKGKLKRIFTREDLDGFKGIIHKADITVGIGRENQQSQDFSIFSIKTRHCPDFSLSYLGDLAYMRFEARATTGSLAQAGFTNDRAGQQQT